MMNKAQESGLTTGLLSPMATIGYIIGSNIGAGVLSMAYASRKAGYLPLLACLVMTCFLCTITMLYITETCLRTRGHHQLSGLTARYLGKIGAGLIFLGVAANSYGALIAYMTGSGNILNTFFGHLGLTKQMGSILFFIPSIIILYIGLTAIGIAQKTISFAMIIMVSILIFATWTNNTTTANHLIQRDWSLSIPIFNISVFIFSAQFLIPELVRGNIKTARVLPQFIMIGMGLSLLIVAIIPASVIALVGLAHVSPVATLSWGEALGDWALYTANSFALLAMLTSYWALGGALFSNIFDYFKLGTETHKIKRIIVLGAIATPPFLLAYSGLGDFVNALYFAGTFGGVLMGIIPIFLLRRSRLTGDHHPEFICGWYSHIVIQNFIIFIFLCSGLYAIAAQCGFLPSSW